MRQRWQGATDGSRGWSKRSGCNLDKTLWVPGSGFWILGPRFKDLTVWLRLCVGKQQGGGRLGQIQKAKLLLLAGIVWYCNVFFTMHLWWEQKEQKVKI